MERFWSTTNNPIRNIWVQNTFYKETAPDKPCEPQSLEFRLQRIDSNGRPDRKIETIRSNFKPGLYKRFRVTNVLEEETRRISPSHFQLKTSELLRSNSKISTNKSVQYSKHSKGKRLHDKSGSITGLLSYPCRQCPSKVPLFPVQRSNVSHDMLTFRPRQCAFNICKSNKLDLSTPKKEKHKKCGVPRRLLDYARRSRNPESAQTIHTKNINTTGLVYKSPKIKHCTKKNIGILGCDMEHGGKQKISCRHKDHLVPKVHKDFSEEGILELDGCKDPSRKVKLCSRGNTSRPSALRVIQRHANRLPQNNRFHKYPVPKPVIQELTWWLKNIRKFSPIHFPPPSKFITTDAADYGWGAIMNN